MASKTLQSSSPAGDITPSTESDIEYGTKDVSSPSKVHEDPRRDLPLWRWVLTLAGLYCGALLYGLDTTVAAAVQTPIYEQFGEVENLAWVGIGFPMASVAVILFLGRLYDLFDTKVLIIASTALFEGGSALCGGAPNMTAMIFGRIIAGIGGAGMYLGALTYISTFARPNELFLYNALIGLTWGLGAILGPIVGGGFAVTAATWRWAFYINLPIAALLSPVYFFLFPSTNPVPDLSVKTKLRTLDWVGVFLNAAVFTLFIVVLTFAGARFPWNSSTVIALWVVWAACLIAFVVQQSFSLFTTPERRIFPVHFLKNKDYVLLFVATACAGVANAVTIYYIPLFFAFTHADGALQAAVRLLPYIIVFIVMVLVAGGSLPQTGRWSLYYIVGGTFILAASAAMFTIRQDTSSSVIYALEALIAVGAGLTFQNAYAVMSAKVAPHDRGNAIGYINVGQIGTTALALAIASCLYQNLGLEFLKEKLVEFNLPEAALRAGLGGAASAQLQAAGPVITGLAIETIAYTIARMFGMSIAAGALLLVGSLLMTHERLDLADQAPVFG